MAKTAKPLRIKGYSDRIDQIFDCELRLWQKNPAAPKSSEKIKTDKLTLVCFLYNRITGDNIFVSQYTSWRDL